MGHNKHRWTHLLRICKRRIFSLLIEVDRDTEEQIDFRQKIAKLHAFGTSEKYRQLYHAHRLNVTFFVQAPNATL